jgi:hypothetical protein
MVLAVTTAACVTAADGESRLRTGLWEIRNTPGAATLDGKALDDLPLPPLEPVRVCLRASDAAAPARFLAGATAADCRVVSSSIKGGRLDVRLACPSADQGAREGAMTLEGRYAPDRYDVNFGTTAFGDNGRMTFSGKLSGRWVGDCPAG